MLWIRKFMIVHESWKWTRVAGEKKDYDVYGSCHKLLSLFLLLFSQVCFVVNLNSDSLKLVQLLEEANIETTCIIQHRQKNKSLCLSLYSPACDSVAFARKCYQFCGNRKHVCETLRHDGTAVKVDRREQKNKEKNNRRPNHAYTRLNLDPFWWCFKPFPSFTAKFFLI